MTAANGLTALEPLDYRADSYLARLHLYILKLLLIIFLINGILVQPIMVYICVMSKQVISIDPYTKLNLLTKNNNQTDKYYYVHKKSIFISSRLEFLHTYQFTILP